MTDLSALIASIIGQKPIDFSARPPTPDEVAARSEELAKMPPDSENEAWLRGAIEVVLEFTHRDSGVSGSLFVVGDEKAGILTAIQIRSLIDMLSDPMVPGETRQIHVN